MKKWYWFKFADGYEVAQAGMNARERKVIERQHGKLISKTPA